MLLESEPEEHLICQPYSWTNTVWIGKGRFEKLAKLNWLLSLKKSIVHLFYWKGNLFSQHWSKAIYFLQQLYGNPVKLAQSKSYRRRTQQTSLTSKKHTEIKEERHWFTHQMLLGEYCCSTICENSIKNSDKLPQMMPFE